MAIMKRNNNKTPFLFIILSFCHSISFAGIPLQVLAETTGQQMASLEPDLVPVPSLAPMLDRVTPAVVNISTRSLVREADNPLLQDPFFRQFFNLPERTRKRHSQSLGSGVIVDAARGYIITNHHVVDKADEITVTLRDKRKIKAKLIGRDPDTDIAVIQIKAENLTALSFADSNKLRVGDFVVAIGNPFGLGQTVTSGIVSALGRSGLGIEGYEDFIQTDASINPGNSGGALVNLRGQLIGVNTAILAARGGGNVGIGFAIPTALIQDVMQQLIEFGVVKRGRLGVYIQDLTLELAKAFNMDNLRGVVVSQIVPQSPAAEVGLKAGDVIISVNGRDVENSSDLKNVIGLLRVGRKVELIIVRNGQQEHLSVLVTEQEQSTIDGRKLSRQLAGAIFGVIKEDGNWSEPVDSIQVISVKPDSLAWQAGLRENDILISINRVLIRDFDEFKQALKRSRRSLLMNIRRGDSALFLLVQ